MPPWPQNQNPGSTPDRISSLANLFKTQLKKKDAAEKDTSPERSGSKLVSEYFKKSLVGITPEISPDNLPPTAVSPEIDLGRLTRVVPLLNDVNDSRVTVGHLLMDFGQTKQLDDSSKEVTIGTYARNETFGDLKMYSFSEKETSKHENNEKETSKDENNEKETSKVHIESPSIGSDEENSRCCPTPKKTDPRGFSGRENLVDFMSKKQTDDHKFLKTFVKENCALLYIPTSTIIKAFNKICGEGYISDYDRFLRLDLFRDEKKIYIKPFTCVSKRIAKSHGTKLYEDGDHSTNVYLVLEGSVLFQKKYRESATNVTNGKNTKSPYSENLDVVDLSPGSIFGYEDIILKRKREFTAVIGCTGTVVYEITFGRFLQFFWNLGNLITNLKWLSAMKANHWRKIYGDKCEYFSNLNREDEMRRNYLVFQKKAESSKVDRGETI